MALAAAALLLGGCGPDPPSESSSAPPVPETAGDPGGGSLPPLTMPPASADDVGFTAVLTEHFHPTADSCGADEFEVAQPPELSEALRVCRPSDGTSTYVRLVNLSKTTLVLDVGTAHAVKTFYPEKETELAKAVFGQVHVKGALLWGGQQPSGALYLPARLSATIVDRGALPSIPIAVDEQHGVAVSHTRAVSDLVDQLPYAKLASVKNVTARAAACVLESLKALNDGTVTLKEAVNGARACRALVDDLRQWWAARYADDVAKGLPPRAPRPPPDGVDTVLRRLTVQTAAADTTVDDILRTITRGLATIR